MGALDATGSVRDPIALAMISAPLYTNVSSPLQRQSLPPEVGGQALDDGNINSPVSPDDVPRDYMSTTFKNIISSAVQLKWNAEGEKLEARHIQKTLSSANAVQRRAYNANASDASLLSENPVAL
jgi:hypothetical protein